MVKHYSLIFLTTKEPITTRSQIWGTSHQWHGATSWKNEDLNSTAEQA